MRAVPDSMRAAIVAGVTTFAHVWRITRRDGAVFGFTDHDNVLLLDGIASAPVAALAPGVIEKSSALSVDTASISGVLDGAAITEADLKRGAWDGARVDVFRVDWRDPSARVHLFAGRIGEVRRGETAFHAELRGLQAPLNVPVGRVFSRYCDADLGDARCGRDISGSAFRAIGAVGEIISQTAFRATGLHGYADGWFARGRLLWADGSQSEVAAHRAEGGGAAIELLDAPGDALAVGAAFNICAGCDKSVATCRAKFANTLNFRGFPHMPGNDAVQAGPAAGTKLDGGSRQS